MATKAKAPAQEIGDGQFAVQRCSIAPIQIAELESELSPKKEQLKEIEARILASMVDSGTEAHKISAGTYTVPDPPCRTVLDWVPLEKYIIEKRALDLLHRRITATAWQARYDSGVLVPGTEAVTVTNLAWRGAK